MRKILLLDGNNLTARAFFSAPDLSRADGVKTGVVFVSLKSIRNIVKQLNPSKVYVCWDKGRSRKRLEIYPEYKANRKHYEGTPEEISKYEDYKRQINRVREYVDFLPITQFQFDYTEADDIIGYLCKINIDKDSAENIVIVSTDKTFWQFLPYGVKVYDPIKEKFIDEDHVKKSCGLPSNRFIYYKAILGEGSDNLSSVKGFGSNAALSILQEDVLSLNDLKERAIKLGAKKKFRDFVENFEVIVRNYRLINLLDVDEFLSPEIRDKIIEGFMNPKTNMNHVEIFKRSFEDDFASIYTNRTEYLRPFQNLLEVN